MRIGLIAGEVPSVDGGRHPVLARARALGELGYEVRVVTIQQPGEWDGAPPFEMLGGHEVRRVRRLDQRVDPPVRGHSGLSQRLGEATLDCDLVHVHDAIGLPGDLVPYLAGSGPVVLSLDDSVAGSSSGGREEPEAGSEGLRFSRMVNCVARLSPGEDESGLSMLDVALRRRALSIQRDVDAAALVVLPSRTHLVRLSEHVAFDPSRAMLIEPGVALRRPESVPRPRPWSGKGPLRVLHLTALSRAAECEHLARVLAWQPRSTVELCVTGQSTSELRNRIAQAWPDLPVAWHGVDEPTGLAQLASECHLAAFPSTSSEGYPLASMEAIALGLPVWAAGAEALRERLGGEVVELLPPLDTREWALAFSDLLHDPERLKIAFDSLPEQVCRVEDAAAILGEQYERLLDLRPPSAQVS